MTYQEKIEAPAAMFSPAEMGLADRHIGRTIRNLRHARGLTQQALAEMVGVKFQQIQKYEIGANRVAGSRLFAIAAALGVAPADLFDGLGAAPATRISREGGEVLRLFETASPERRAAVLALLRSL